MSYIDTGANISECGLYRYQLWRRWADGEPLVFVMLNPSTADASEDDPTIRRCVGFAKANGFGWVKVVNLFAFRATDPAGLRKAVDPIGPDNDRHIIESCQGNTVVAAWGGVVQKWPMPRWSERAYVVKRMVSAVGKLHHLGLTKDRHPKHPLYIPAGQPLVPFGVARV